MLALALTEVLLPLFDHVLGLPIELAYLRDWPLLLGLVLGIGLIAHRLSSGWIAGSGVDAAARFGAAVILTLVSGLAAGAGVVLRGRATIAPGGGL